MRPLPPLFLLLFAAPLLAADDADEAAKTIAKGLAQKEDDAVRAALLEATGNQSPSLTAPLCRLLRHKNPAVRQGAIEVLGGRTDLASQKKAASALGARLDPLCTEDAQDQEELGKVIQALHDLAQPSSIKALLDLKAGAPRELRLQAAMAVANVPTREAVERLLQYGYKDRRGEDRTRDVATRALRYATQAEVKGGIEAWRKWWKENESSFDPIVASEKRAEARQKQDGKKPRKKKGIREGG